jgi:hypothetical protein
MPAHNPLQLGGKRAVATQQCQKQQLQVLPKLPASPILSPSLLTIPQAGSAAEKHPEPQEAGTINACHVPHQLQLWVGLTDWSKKAATSTLGHSLRLTGRQVKAIQSGVVSTAGGWVARPSASRRVDHDQQQIALETQPSHRSLHYVTHT